MINTSEMYGNVQEEPDSFKQLQEKAQTIEKNKAEAMRGMQRGPDLSKYMPKNEPVNTYSEQLHEKEMTGYTEAMQKQYGTNDIVIPDFPEEYIETTALETMYNMQEALQNILAKKRGTLAPTNTADNHENAKRSGYFMMSTVTELFELMEQLEKDNYEITNEVKAEAVDALHFVYNQLLYLKYRPKMTLQKFYDLAVEDTKTGTIGSNSLQYLIGDFIIAVGDLYQNVASYKDWRVYDTWKEDPLKIQELGDKMFIKFMKIFVNLDMSPAEIYACYRSKNIENVNRQRKNGRYEK